MPLTLHGVIAGVLITFILAIGFFITPALMGGPGDIMIAMLIEREVEMTQNWPSAAMMTIVLLDRDAHPLRHLQPLRGGGGAAMMGPSCAPRC
jgi:ABC-type spermidine/putrescine transport system permease subunit II